MDLKTDKTMNLGIFDIKDLCTGCGACVSSCPKHALSLKYDDEGFYFPELDADKCIGCKLCEKACHIINAEYKQEEPSLKYKVYMLKSKNLDLVKKSSSGGVFSLLADEILKMGGAVYGARYNYSKERLEQCSTDHCSMEELRKSKYIESYTGSIFNDVFQDLKNNRQVLYCGTPCQVEGLKHFLTIKNADTENLLLVRFICHGVPSNKFFTEYKHHEEKKYHSQMVSFDFRPKIRGWRNSDWQMRFKNGKTVTGPSSYFYYYNNYYNNCCSTLRRCCYYCTRVFNETTDFTIADFWGIGRYLPDNHDNEGVSAVFVHSPKAEHYLRAISDKCFCEEIPKTAIDYIYKEATNRECFIDKRNIVMEEVGKKGYMPVVIRKLRLKILSNKVKDKVYRIYKIWRRRK